MAEYLLRVHATAEGKTRQAGDQAEMKRMNAAAEVFNQELRDTGAWAHSDGLQPFDTAFFIDAASGSVPG